MDSQSKSLSHHPSDHSDDLQGAQSTPAYMIARGFTLTNPLRNHQQASASSHELSEEKKRQRRESHKAVEKRRRESLNDGITELQKLLPEPEKNKGRIIHAAVEYIKELRTESETHLDQMSKWTFEKMLLQDQIALMRNELYSLKEENARLMDALHHQNA